MAQAPSFADSSRRLRESVDTWNLNDLRKALQIPAQSARSLAKPLRSWDAALGKLNNSSDLIRAWDDRLQALVTAQAAMRSPDTTAVSASSHAPDTTP